MTTTITEEIELQTTSLRKTGALEDAAQNVLSEHQQNSEISPPPPRSKFKTIGVVSGLLTALWISALSENILATAIPTICAELGSASGYSWLGGAYVLANGAAVPIWAKLSDIWGRKPILLMASSGFFVASIVAARSSDMKMLIASRALQGMFGGGLVQMVYITISDLFSARERSLYYGLLQIMWTIASGVGPIFGGLFAQTVGWRWCFWINLPVATLAFTLIFFNLDVHNPRTNLIDGLKAIDWLGTATMLGFVIMILLGLDLGGTVYPWNSPRVLCLIIVGCLMVGAFIIVEKKYAKDALIPMELFRHSSTNACIIVGTTFDFAWVGGSYYLPLFFQLVHQESPVHSGLSVIPYLVSGSATAIGISLLIHKTGRYVEVIRVGQALMTLGFGLFIQFSSNTPTGTLVACQIVAGIGTGCLFTPPLVALQAAVPNEQQSSATASLGFIRILSVAVSIVVGGAILQNSMSSRAPALLDAGISATVVERLTMGGGAAANIQLVTSIIEPAKRAALQDALSWSMRNMWITYTAVAGVGLIASAFVTHHVLGTDHVEVKTGLKKE